ncbi:MAG: lysophospholipid acyltransferase family protein [Myxococcota bacterium]
MSLDDWITVGLLSNLKDAVIDDQIAKAIDRASKAMNINERGYDPWGFHPDTAKIYFSIAKQVYRYFRPSVHGIDNIPAGRVLIVPNHSGQLPFDGLVVAVACLLECDPPRLLRAMAEKWFPTLPFLNIAFSRSGVTVGDPINCRNLLEADNSILVFPEGVRGSGKTWWHRYELAGFGRGFMRLALQTKAPIIPVGVVGAEESIISIANAKPLARLFGAPYLPVPALLPVLGPLAYLPMPTRFHVYFGEPLTFDGPFDDEDGAVQEKVEVVEQAVTELLDRGRAERRGWFD